jgi:DNA-binding NarL/FixJ family response regulator
MPSVTTPISGSLNRILVIDDLPLIPVAFQEVFRKTNPSAHVSYSENIYAALSAKAWDNTVFDLVIIGTLHESYTTSLQLAVSDLRNRFGQPLIMIYSSVYDPAIVQNMTNAGIDAYVHKYEPVHEIRRVYEQLSKGEPCVSAIFLTLLSYPHIPPTH